jgi:glucose-6-phosphate 1-epimerase
MTHARKTTSIERFQQGELVCWRLQSPAGELILSEQGAQVLSYREWDQPPLIWLSEQANYRQGEAQRGGVPVCWPWFGDLARNPESVQAMHGGSVPAGAHGLVRQSDWQLEELEDVGDAVQLRLSFAAEQLPGWNGSAQLELEIRLGARLQLRLTTCNTGKQPLALSQALHTYFAVSDIRQVSAAGLEDCRYVETLEDWQIREQQGAVQFSGETDRIYLQTPELIRVRDAGWQRQICLRASGSRSAVVWNPWIDKAKRLSQFADDAWQQMLCIETANVADDIVTLAPGAEHSLALELWSEPLA